MNATEARALARKMMDDNGLGQWKVEINDNKSRLGYCDYMRNTLAFSTFFFNQENAREMFLNTVRHEMAHAIVGPLVKAHGSEWRAACRRLGGVARASTLVKVDDSEFSWVGRCPCGKGIKRNHRKPQSFSWTCRSCGEVLSWTHNGRPVVVNTRNAIFGSAVPASRPSTGRKPRTRPVKDGGRRRTAFDPAGGFTDIEALWAD